MNYPQGGAGWQQVPPPNMPPQFHPGQQYPPGYYSPPPPKKKKTWLWVLLAVLTVIVLAVGGGIAFFAVKFREANTSTDVTLTYELTGTGTSASVWYSYDDIPASDKTNVAVPWTKDVSAETKQPFYLVAKAVAKGETVTCKVSIAGKVIVKRTSPSFEQSAQCAGIVPTSER